MRKQSSMLDLVDKDGRVRTPSLLYACLVFASRHLVMLFLFAIGAMWSKLQGLGYDNIYLPPAVLLPLGFLGFAALVVLVLRDRLPVGMVRRVAALLRPLGILVLLGQIGVAYLLLPHGHPSVGLVVEMLLTAYLVGYLAMSSKLGRYLELMSEFEQEER